MAISSKCSWEVRTTGSDANSGGFNKTATGTDYSQQDAAQYSGTDLVIDGTTNTLVSSASHNFVAADVGNLIYISAGTGFTFGRFEIVSVASNKATLDRSAGTLSSTGGTYAVGGALAWPGIACANAAPGNNIWVKSGTYTLTNSTSNISGGKVTVTTDGGNPDSGSVVMEGYQTSRGDLGTRPIIRNPSSGGFASITVVSGGESSSCRNIEVDAGSNTSSTCFGSGGSYGRMFRCLARNFTSYGFNVSNDFEVTYCGATGGVGSGSVGFNNNVPVFCEAWSNAGTGFNTGGASYCEAWECATGFKPSATPVAFTNCLAYRNTSKGFDISGGSVGVVLVNCTAAYNTSDGFNLQWSSYYGIQLHNCIAYGNGGWGFNVSSAAGSVMASNIAGGSNTSGNWGTTGTQASAGEKLQGASTFYYFRNVRPADLIALTASPFTSASGTTGGARDFSLNTTAGGGAACRGVGTWTTTPSGNTHTSDLGAIPATTTTGGGSGVSRSRQVMG